MFPHRWSWEWTRKVASGMMGLETKDKRQKTKEITSWLQFFSQLYALPIFISLGIRTWWAELLVCGDLSSKVTSAFCAIEDLLPMQFFKGSHFWVDPGWVQLDDLTPKILTDWISFSPAKVASGALQPFCSFVWGPPLAKLPLSAELCFVLITGL